MPKTDESGHTENYWLQVETVFSFLLKNQDYLHINRSKDLIRMVMEELKCEERTAQRYISEAKKKDRRLLQKDPVKAFKKALRDRAELISALDLQIAECPSPSVKARFLALKQQAMKDRDELCGLYEKKEKTPRDEILNLNIDYSKLNQRQLQRLAAGEDIRAVLADTDNNHVNDSTDKSQG